jgi:hypothetical protein
MNRLRIAIAAAAMLLVGALFLDGLVFGTEELARKENLQCTSCHDKPGSKLLTDKGKYYETMRSLGGYEELKATFGACTQCHDRKPGSKRLTKQGRQFLDLVRDMEGLRDWMQQHHPVAPPAPPEGEAE